MDNETKEINGVEEGIVEMGLKEDYDTILYGNHRNHIFCIPVWKVYSHIQCCYEDDNV